METQTRKSDTRCSRVVLTPAMMAHVVFPFLLSWPLGQHSENIVINCYFEERRY